MLTELETRELVTRAKRMKICSLLHRTRTLPRWRSMKSTGLYFVPRLQCGM
ncbi:hypothetical protein GUITHDRAFT_153786, partial [Guillardia theta CCMP2712]